MKKLLAILLATLMLLSLCACTAKPAVPNTPDTTAETAGGKSFTVMVTHGDNSEKVFQYTTQAEKLGSYLETQGLIESEGADDGMFHTVDGEKADWNENQSYWAFYIDGEYAMTGIYDTVIADGCAYKLVYTIG